MRVPGSWLGAGLLCVGGVSAAAIAYLTVSTPAQTVTVRVGPAPPLVAEVADSTDERNEGLMGVRELRPRQGMIFAFDQRESVTIWMYRTAIPLSLVFVDGDRVVGVEELPPCVEEDPDRCPRYLSPTAVTHAVEASAGFFTDAGVGVGDRMSVVGGKTP